MPLVVLGKQQLRLDQLADGVNGFNDLVRFGF